MTIPSPARRGQHGSQQVRPDFVEAEATGFLVGILAFGAKRCDVVVAIDDGHPIEGSDAGIIGRHQQRVEGKADRAIAVRERIDEVVGSDLGGISHEPTCWELPTIIANGGGFRMGMGGLAVGLPVGDLPSGDLPDDDLPFVALATFVESCGSI